MNKSNKHFEIHFEKLTQRQWQSKEFPVCESVSVISMEIESELEALEERPHVLAGLDATETQRNTWLILRASYHFRQRYQREKLWSWLPAFHKEQLQRGTLHFSHDLA
jgi:hypothetical protein